MNLKEINSKAGPISDYSGYIILLFVYNLINRGYAMVVPESAGAVFQAVPVVLTMLVGPIVFAIVYGGIYERQTVQYELERKGFFSQIKMHSLRLFGAQLFSLFISYLVLIVALLVAGGMVKLGSSNLFNAVLNASSSVLVLFWFSALVVEPKLFRSLIHAIKTLLSNPAALGIGIVWFVLCAADGVAFDFKSGQTPLVINLALSGVFAVLKTIAIMYILVIYKNAWGSLIQRIQAAEILAGSSKSRPGEGFAKASLGFTFFAFVPLVHLVAMILGIVSLKRGRRFILKAAIACCVGGFFTILYALLVVGYFAGHTSTVRMPDYSFLADGNTELQPYVDFLDQGTFEDVKAQLGGSSGETSNRGWAFDTALGLAKYQEHDLDGAKQDFYNASQKKPERSEFYFYYGLVLLDYNETDMAREQFQLAVEHEPKLEIADRYLGLVNNLYKPDMIGSALMYLIILILLFSLHEYGHAFAAWKLGDDTAKNQGRLTLNPAVHLDLFGSIILPGILLFTQANILFGWARPVPVNTGNLKNPIKDHMLISFAGPAVNLLIAMACAIILVLIVLLTRLLWPETLSLNLVAPFSATSLIGPPLSKGILVFIIFLKQLLYTSLILGFFNLIPIPPLDGSWILAGFLPERLRGIFEYIGRFGFLLFILLSLTPVFDYLLGVPIGIAWLGLRLVISAMGFA